MLNPHSQVLPTQVQMGNLHFSLGRVQYDGESPVAFPVAAQVGLGVGTSLLALGVIVIVLMYRWVTADVAGLGRMGLAWGGVVNIFSEGQIRGLQAKESLSQPLSSAVMYKNSHGQYVNT